MTAIEVIVALIVGVVGAAAGYFVGYNNRKKTAEAPVSYTHLTLPTTERV